MILRYVGPGSPGNRTEINFSLKKNSYLYFWKFRKRDLMMKSFKKIAIPFLFLMLFSACASKKTIDSARNLAYLYNPSMSALHPRYLVYHESDQSSVLSVKVYPVELLFNQANEAGEYRAQLDIYYRLYEINGVRTLVDTGDFSYFINMNNVRREFVANIPLSAEYPKKYTLEVIINDFLRNKAVQAFIPIDKTSPYNYQNFQIVRLNSEQKVFNPILDSNQVVQVRYPSNDLDSLYISYFRVDSIVPYPPSFLIPSRTMRQEPDTVYAIANNDSSALKLTREGMYHLTVDTTVTEGYTFFYFGEHFPSVKTTGQLIDPLEYLISDAEISRMRRSENPKLAVDNFWKNTTGSIDKARELIRIYYNRVFYANYFFVSYKEGWKTDRGMIYIIYGPPDVLYKNDEEERWIYGKERSEIRISFTFRKVDSPYSQNEYILSRSDDMNSRWGEAINSWKSGIVYSVDQPNSR
jgi:GWxTD domain-containing protein